MTETAEMATTMSNSRMGTLVAVLAPDALLRPFRVAVTVAEATQYLEQIMGPVRILGLYDHFFPEEYAASQARALVNPVELYSPKEIEFFSLVHERLFPLAYWFIDMENNPEEGEGREDYLIPVWPDGNPVQDDCSLRDMSLGWQMVVALMGVMRDDESEIEAELMARIERLPGIDFAHFRYVTEACGAAGGELAHLEMACRIVDRNSNCVWLDAYPDSALGPGIEQGWSIEGIQWLRDE